MIRSGSQLGLPLAVAMVTCSLASISEAQMEPFVARLSWSPTSSVTNLVPTQRRASLFVLLEGVERPVDFRYHLHYSSQDSDGSCFRVLAAPSAAASEAAFRPTAVDSSDAGREMRGRMFTWEDGNVLRVRFDLEFGAECFPFPMRFILGHIEVDLEDGTTKRFWSGSEATVLDGQDVSFQPIIRNAMPYGTDDELRVWAVMAQSDTSSISFSLWQPSHVAQYPTDVTYFGTTHVLLRFPSAPSAASYLIASDGGRSTRFLVPVVGESPDSETLVVDAADPQGFPNINAALAVARDGDTILVRPGYYRERLMVKKRVRIVSSGGPEVTTIDGGYGGTHVVRWDPGSFAPSALVGFTVTGGGGDSYDDRSPIDFDASAEVPLNEDRTGGGVHIPEGSSVLLSNDILVGNNAELAGTSMRYGAGASSRGTSLLIENTLVGNDRTLLGGGLFVGSSAEDLILSNSFDANEAIVAGGGVYFAGVEGFAGSSSSSPEARRTFFVDNQVIGNQATDSGGGVFVSNGLDVAISKSQFKENVLYLNDCPFQGASRGGAVYVDSDSRVSISKCEFRGHAACWGGAIFSSSSLNVSLNVFRENSAGWAGGAIYAVGSEAGWIRGNDFVSNSVLVERPEYGQDRIGGGAVYLAGFSGEIGSNLFWSNNVRIMSEETSEGLGGALLVQPAVPPTPQSTVDVVGNSFVGNESGGASAVCIDAPAPEFATPSVDFRSNVVAYGVGRSPIRGVFRSATCNVLWENGGGAELPTAVRLGPCAWVIDPLFCDVEHDAQGVDESSILLRGRITDACDCGPIGRAVARCEGPGDGIDTETSEVAENRIMTSIGGAVTIGFRITSASAVRVEVFDITGRMVLVISDAIYERGEHVVTWNGTREDGQDVPQGVYLVRVQVDDSVQTHKAVLLRK